MSLPGNGLSSASCSAYRNTNGVAIPEVSAGSRNEDAIETSNAMVSCPSGDCADAAGAASAMPSAKASPTKCRAIGHLLTVRAWSLVSRHVLMAGDQERSRETEVGHEAREEPERRGAEGEAA